MITENIKTLVSKELKHYLNTPPSYVLASVFLLLCGYFFAQPLFLINQANLNSLIDIAPLILTFFAPALSMKLIAEEKKTQTIEILLTMPFSEEEIIISKFISASLIMITTIFLMFIYSITLYFLSKPDTGHILGSYLSLLFTAVCFLSIGVFSSTLSSSQINAFISGFAISFFFYLCGKVTFFLPLYLQEAANYIGIDSHISNMSRGVIDFRDIIYFLSISFIFIYLSINKLKNMRVR
jgi:ABC-2 type transport system permease protein